MEDLIPTRKSLLVRLKDLGDDESWRLFFETYWGLIYRAALRAGLSHSEAEDVVQETVIAVAKYIPKFNYDPEKGSFKTYLLRMTGWRISGQFRKRMPAAQLLNEQDGENGFETGSVPAWPAVESLWEQEWEGNLLRAAVDRVKSRVDGKQYQIFDLNVNQGWPVAKVAQDLNVTRARVYVAKHQISKMLRKEIERLRERPI